MLNRRSLLSLLPFTVLVLSGFAPATVGDKDGSTRLLRTPTVSATQIAFAYANNIWIVERAGGIARRLTSFPGPDRQSALLARRQMDRLQRANTPATSTSTWSPPKAASPSASPGIPAPTPCRAGRPTARSVLFASARATAGAQRRAALLDRAGRRRRRRADGAAARLSGQDLRPTARTSPTA